MDERKAGLGAPLQAYLEIAHEYYMEDRLDAAMAVVEDSFSRQGWPPGLWTAFYNELVCEKDARDASDIHRVDEQLSIELPRMYGQDVIRTLTSISLESRRQVGARLEVRYLRPVIITIFLPDAPVDFIIGSHGYVMHKHALDKICLPYQVLQSRKEIQSALLHEFSHVASYELSGFEIPHWLNEGLATYLCDDLSVSEHWSLVDSTVRDGNMLSISRLQSILTEKDQDNDDPDQVLAAYYVAGTLVTWWVRHLGMESLRDALIRIGDGQPWKRAVSQAAGMSLRKIEHQWRQYLHSEIAGMTNGLS